MSLVAKTREIEPSFRDGFEDVLLDWLTRERRTATGRAELTLEVLAPAHRNSPFLTLAEGSDPAGEGLPWRVIKLLVVTEEDASEPFWRDVLRRESSRWREELGRRLARSGRVETLGLPLSAPPEGHEALVGTADLGPLRRADLMDGESTETTLTLPYLYRPFVAWPRLADLGCSAEDLRRRWELYCRDHGVAEHLFGPLFPHFCDEALTGGHGDLLWTSAWRLEAGR